MKTLIISHGDKGGSGKSFFALTVASLLELNQQPFLLVEADANEMGGQPDVGPRFENSEFAQVVKAPISGDGSAEDLISDLFELIQQSDAEYVVVNTPAGASEHLEKVGELIGLACQSLGYRLMIFYSLFKTQIAELQAKHVLRGRLAKYASDFFFVKNAFFGAWDGRLIFGKYTPFTVPLIHNNVMQRLTFNHNFVDALNNFPMMQKLQLEQFFKSLDAQNLFETIKTKQD